MGYQESLQKAWKDLELAGLCGTQEVRFFTEEFRVDPSDHSVLTVSGQGAKDFVSILVLHYLKKRLEGLPPLSNSWISFRELESGEAYYPAFRRRSIDLVLKKYGGDPAAVTAVCGRMPSARKAEQGDAGVIVDAFAGVPLQVIIWAGDDEFPAEANILFDRGIGSIFCTEDVAVLAGFVTKYI